MDRLTAMAIFTHVVDSGSFSAAAQYFRLSKSSVSKHIAALEEKLGARLLNRTTRRLTLTEVGASFYERCQRIVAEAEEAEQTVSEMRGAPRGLLRLNAPMSFGQLHIAPAVADFLREYPDIRLDLTLNDRQLDLVEGGFDLGIRIAELADSSLIARRLAPVRLVVCGAPAYFERRGVPKKPRDLLQHNCLHYTYLSTRDSWRLQSARGRELVRVAGDFQSNNGDALQAAARAGLGLVQLPTFIVGADLRSGALRPVLQRYDVKSMSVWAIYPHTRHVSPKVRVFVDFLAARFGPRPYWDEES